MPHEFRKAQIKPSRVAALIEQSEAAALYVDQDAETVEIELTRHIAGSAVRDAPADFSEAEALTLVMAGARRLTATLAQIEKTAARMAREHGVTVAELARRAQITERAAMTRYRRRRDAPAEELLDLAIRARRTARIDPDDVLFALNARADRVLCGLSTSGRASGPDPARLAAQVSDALQVAGLRLDYAPREPSRYYGQDPTAVLAAGGLVEIVQDVEASNEVPQPYGL